MNKVYILQINNIAYIKSRSYNEIVITTNPNLAMKFDKYGHAMIDANSINSILGKPLTKAVSYDYIGEIQTEQ